ncbi:MAG: hypothetical protein G01um10142_352 [Parcubacteria group bacterium Gr01-1014_2]|nr:MAG: hypothetical protein G01um10142_352 [Parcubacteria group bacterium Gr01-1014_2]
MPKTLLIIVIIVALAVVGYWFWQSRIQEPGSGLPKIPQVSDEDTTKQINQDLDQINLGDIDAEFKNIDVDLNNL